MKKHLTLIVSICIILFFACLYFIESNHDEEMLMNGPYPPFLKQSLKHYIIDKCVFQAFYQNY